MQIATSGGKAGITGLQRFGSETESGYMSEWYTGVQTIPVMSAFRTNNFLPLSALHIPVDAWILRSHEKPNKDPVNSQF